MRKGNSDRLNSRRQKKEERKEEIYITLGKEKKKGKKAYKFLKNYLKKRQA